jgi:xylitol oxidase
LGVVARLELDIEPTYLVQQEVRLGLPWSVIETRFDDITAAGYSVSMFTRFAGEDENQLWVKTRTGAPGTSDAFGTVAVDGPTHMLRGGSTEALTGQGGLPGPWLDRLPHFRMEFTPSRGEELQTEYFLPRDQAWPALEALRRLEPTFGPLLQVAEIRTVAAESLWLSGAHDRDTVGVHFTWVRDEPAVRSALRPIEDALVPLGARPHWGKVFELDRSVVAGAFARYDDFVRLREAVDPEGKFGNAFLERYLP